MNRDWFGDSYDIVKRFFLEALRAGGYDVYVDPMPTGDWASCEAAFLDFLRAKHVREAQGAVGSALLLDPDTGIGVQPSRKHTTVAGIVALLKRHSIVVVFDQSFSRNMDTRAQLDGKLQQLHLAGAHGFYYDSHARFLFASLSADALRRLRDSLVRLGLPAERLVGLNSHAI